MYSFVVLLLLYCHMPCIIRCLVMKELSHEFREGSNDLSLAHSGSLDLRVGARRFREGTQFV